MFFVFCFLLFFLFINIKITKDVLIFNFFLILTILVGYGVGGCHT